MVDAKLYTSPVSYPKIEAVSGSKLAFTKQDRLKINVRTKIIKLEAARASTSDPWVIQVVTEQDTVPLIFARDPVTVDSDNLNWKAMADLALKAHQRSTGEQTWAFIGPGGTPGIPVWKVDATKPSGYANCTVTEAATVLSATVDQSGDISVMFKPGSSGYVIPVIGPTENAVRTMMAYIFAQTGTSVSTGTPPAIEDMGSDNGTIGASVGARYTFQSMSGTDGLSLGNYSGGEIRATLRIDAYGTMQAVESIRKLDPNDVLSLPSIQLDKIRRATTSGVQPTLDVEWMADTNSFAVTMHWWAVGFNGNTAGKWAAASVANPNGVYELDFDQVNSLDVLATAAFAGVGGLAAVGTQAALEQLLSESILNTTFGKLAVSLGTTTAALISGYASALIAAYINGWISNDQLFDMQNHVGWLTTGANAIAMAAAAGVAVGSVNALLTYMGVSNNVLSMALNAVGGAATSAGVALGMASVMSKVVRHTYWGE